MSKVKVTLRVPTAGAKRGDVVEVDSATADFLTENGHGVRVQAASKPKGDDKS